MVDVDTRKLRRRVIFLDLFVNYCFEFMTKILSNIRHMYSDDSEIRKQSNRLMYFPGELKRNWNALRKNDRIMFEESSLEFYIGMLTKTKELLDNYGADDLGISRREHRRAKRKFLTGLNSFLFIKLVVDKFDSINISNVSRKIELANKDKVNVKLLFFVDTKRKHAVLELLELAVKNKKKSLNECYHKLVDKVFESIETCVAVKAKNFSWGFIDEIRIHILGVGGGQAEYPPEIEREKNLIYHNGNWVNVNMLQEMKRFEINLDLKYISEKSKRTLVRALFHEISHALDNYSFEERRDFEQLLRIRAEGIALFAELIENQDVFFEERVIDPSARSRLRYYKNDLSGIYSAHQLDRIVESSREGESLYYKWGFAIVFDMFLNLIGKGDLTKKILLNLVNDQELVKSLINKHKDKAIMLVKILSSSAKLERFLDYYFKKSQNPIFGLTILREVKGTSVRKEAA